MNFKRLSTDEMLTYARSVLYPIADESSSDEIDVRQFIFCLNCPDPVGTLDILYEAPQGVDIVTVVKQALSMSTKALASYSAESLALDHPLRRFALPK